LILLSVLFFATFFFAFLLFFHLVVSVALHFFIFSQTLIIAAGYKFYFLFFSSIAPNKELLS